MYLAHVLTVACLPNSVYLYGSPKLCKFHKCMIFSFFQIIFTNDPTGLALVGRMHGALDVANIFWGLKLHEWYNPQNCGIYVPHKNQLAIRYACQSLLLKTPLYVTGFGKRCIVHVSNFEYFKIYKNHRNGSYKDLTF